MKENRVILVWLRSDLRLHDHTALTLALKQAQQSEAKLLLLWLWPDGADNLTSLGDRRIESPRAHFLLSCARALSADIQHRGGRLLLCHGRAEQVIPQVVKRLNVTQVYAHHASAHDEVQEELRVGRDLAQLGVHLTLHWGHTLFERAQLPFKLSALPDVFTQFRKKVARDAQPHRWLPSPVELTPPPEGLDERLASLQLRPAPEPPNWRPDERACISFDASEQGALDRVQDYLWERGCIDTYRQTRNELIGESYSTKLSPWLAIGALSPRYVWHEILRYEQERVENDSTYWVRFELLWREYFQWVALKWGARLFQRGGLKSSEPLKRDSMSLSARAQGAFERWRAGETDDSFVNANMRELSTTGFMSNRGRQNVASYLVHDLGVDWRAGATYFESLLIDYDPASNWGNWAYVAGVGNDPRPQRRFNTNAQAERYDEAHTYRDLWR